MKKYIRLIQELPLKKKHCHIFLCARFDCINFLLCKLYGRFHVNSWSRTQFYLGFVPRFQKFFDKPNFPLNLVRLDFDVATFDSNCFGNKRKTYFWLQKRKRIRIFLFGFAICNFVNHSNLCASAFVWIYKHDIWSIQYCSYFVVFVNNSRNYNFVLFVPQKGYWHKNDFAFCFRTGGFKFFRRLCEWRLF